MPIESVTVDHPRREQYWRDGWSVGSDDDSPRVPEVPEWLALLGSGQAKRAAEQTVYRTDRS